MNFLSFAIFPMLILAHGMSIELKGGTFDVAKQEYRIIKRDVSDAKSLGRQREFYGFVEDKLVQHSQALEHLVKLVNDAVVALHGLAENLGSNFEEPKLPEKIEVQHEEKARSQDADESRRFAWGKPLSFPGLYNFKTATSPWCSVAVLCHRTRMTVCGYDDMFGYGKFDDLCHLIQVNCYWKYNFALVPNCKPTFGSIRH